MTIMGKLDWHYLLFLLLAHHPPARIRRTIHFTIVGKNFYLCARCTGRYSALIGVFAVYLIGYSFPLWLYLPLIAVLPLPGIADWLSQSCKIRESTNPIRVGTGVLLGIAEALLLLLLIKGLFLMLLFGAAIIGAYAFSIYLLALKTSCFKSYLEDITQGN